MTDTLTWTHPVAVGELPEDGKDFALVPDEATRAALAQLVGVLALPSLAAHLSVQPDGRGGVSVEGTLTATAWQTCVVTLEPFDNPISEPISLRFAPPETIEVETAPLAEIGEEDPPDPLVNGTLDLAAVVAEFLALSIDPYPRKPGAVFAPPGDAETDQESSPFAALERLKRRNGE